MKTVQQEFPGPRLFLEWAMNRETDECIPWPEHFATTPQGYGSIRIGGRKGRSWGAHEVVLERRVGPRPPGMEVAHLPVVCHTRLCVNYRHLRWDTRQSNRRDMKLDGTEIYGERNGQAKLNIEDVAGILQRWGAGCTQSEIAEHYGVERSTVSVIVNGKSWSHV